MTEEPTGSNAQVMVMALAAIAIVGIYWYYMKKQDELLGELYREAKQGTRVDSSNHADSSHLAKHEGVAGSD